ncbi:MAG: PspA/IM30 family protein [Erythrobacter sp.]|nr:PspA/IM30 family protein [Erythrobacter sp.]
MPGFASKLQDMITRNVESVIEAATSPSKQLLSLQREIEETIIELEGERSRVNARKVRLEGKLVQNELKEADWEDKAKMAMEHGREDLARQALMAREASQAAIDKARQDLAQTHRDLAEIEKTMMELEAKRAETIERARAQAEVDALNADDDGEGTLASTADALRSKIAELQKRAEFAADSFMEKRAQPSVDQELEEVQNKRRIDIEIEAMKRARGTDKSSED